MSNKTLYVVTDPNRWAFTPEKSPRLRELKVTETAKQYRLVQREYIKELGNNVQFDKERSEHLSWDAKTALTQYQERKRDKIAALEMEIEETRMHLAWVNDQIAKLNG